MKIITHENLWWWGKSYTMIADDGKSMIELAIEDDEERNYFGTIQSCLCMNRYGSKDAAILC